MVPFLLTTVGGFTPRTPNYDGGGIFDPKDAINALFPRGTVPMRGSLGTSIEEGRIRSIAADAVSDNNNALYDQTLPRSTAIGMLHNQILRRFSHAAVIGSANSVLDVLHRNF